MVYSYRVKMNKTIDRLLTHNFLTTFFGKPLEAPVWVKARGRSLHLRTDKEIATGPFEFSTQELGNISVEIEPSNATVVKTKEGDKVRLSGLVSYSRTYKKPKIVNGRKINKSCPVHTSAPDNILDMDTLSEFIHKNTGITFNQKDLEVDPIETEFIGPRRRVYDGFHINVEGRVKDSRTFDKLAYSSIGASKSYGFGSVDIFKI